MRSRIIEWDATGRGDPNQIFLLGSCANCLWASSGAGLLPIVEPPHFIAKLTFRFMLLKRAHTRNEFEQLFFHTDFRKVEVREDLIDSRCGLRSDSLLQKITRHLIT